MWRDVIELISIAHSDDAVVSVTESIRSVFANKKTVTRTEFYQAISNDLKPTATFEIRSMEYNAEQKLRHEGKDYIILRTYSKNGETIDLVCQAYHDVQANLAKLRDTVEIWQNVSIDNSMGEKTHSGEMLYRVPAHIEYKGGGTGRAEGVIETTNNAVVTIRFREGVKPDMFLMVDGQRWEIRYIEDPFNRHETLVLTVERVVP